MAESEATIEALGTCLIQWGCPPERSREMAEQLLRRADQLAAAKGRSKEEALSHLLQLMRHGWAAPPGANTPPPPPGSPS